MSDASYDPSCLPDLLPIYYKKLFPYGPYFRWLNYGGVPKNYFANREFSFTLKDDVYIRYQSFSDQQDLEREIQKRCPYKIDIGAVFTHRPKDHKTIKAAAFQAQEKELVFDIDMTDYDDVRYCCSGADICSKCWPLMQIAIKIVDRALRDDFGFDHLLWVYSGRRGVHCWVCDDVARKLSQMGRSAIAEYLSVVKGGENQTKKVSLDDRVHPSIQCAIDIVEKYFQDYALKKQDILGTEERCSKVLQLVPDEIREDLEKYLEKFETSKQKWIVLEKKEEEARNQGQYKKSQNITEEIMLQYCYPRLDVNVSKGVNHLLKSPFCIHPKTGRVCVPIDPDTIEKFNPFDVPTVSTIVEELNKTEATDEQGRKVKDYKRTSLKTSVQVFEKFLSGLEKTWKGKLLEQSGEIRERFLTFQNVSSSTTGERLSSEILSFITDVGLNPDRLRSQCYDGAGNMTGKVKGVGPRIQRLYPKALHFWCVSHLLNRCIVAACDLQQVRNMMGTADKVVTFFNWSPIRQTVLEDHVQKINTDTKRTKLLELCRTRWIQRHDAFEAFKDFLPVLVDALEDYLRKETRPDANTEASGLLHAITAFPFIMTLVTVQQCLGYIKSLSKVLQGRALDIVRAMDEVTTVADTLTKLRANIDAYSGELFTEAVKLAESIDVQPAVPRLCGRQTKRANTPASTPEEYYKRSLVIPFLDHLNQQMADRFSELNRKGTMGLHLIPPGENSVKPQTLSFFEDDLPSPATLSQEIELWRRKWTGHQTPPATLQETLKACNGQLYPNIKTVLQITATFPVTSCECERSISTLGIVKTKLRATMGQDRLTGLCLLSRHRDIHVEPRDIVKMYARKNPRRMVLPDILADDEET